MGGGGQGGRLVPWIYFSACTKLADMAGGVLRKIDQKKKEKRKINLSFPIYYQNRDFLVIHQKIESISSVHSANGSV